MFGRKTWIQLITKLGIGASALCVVGVLLAAIPNHHAPTVPLLAAEQEQEPQSGDHSSTSGMEMGPQDASVGEHGAMLEMQHKAAARRGIPARWQWSCDDPRSLERLGLRLVESATITRLPSGLRARLPLRYRLLPLAWPVFGKAMTLSLFQAG